jgi:hypothetical protein
MPWLIGTAIVVAPNSVAMQDSAGGTRAGSCGMRIT